MCNFTLKKSIKSNIMKKILLLFCFLSSFFSFAQNPDLLNTNWQIIKIIWNGTEYTPPTMPFSQSTYFYPNSQNPNIFSNFSNNISGSFNFNSDNVTFTKNSCGCTLADYWGDSGQVNQFSGMNCNFFVMPNSGNFSYNISTIGNTKTLEITNPLGNKIFYDYKNLSTKDNNIKLIKIYPNPVSDFITIENLKTNSLVKIIDTSGKVVLNKKLSGNSIDVKSLSKGTYFLKIDGLKPLKFIKK